MYPIKFSPDYKDRVWGGNKLQTVLNKEIPNNHTGESWEIACHNHGQSIVENGDYKGLTLYELLSAHGEEIIGKAFGPEDKFPLLIKFIDAKSKLSVQVHPDDAYAKIYENGELGKSEAWYILQADPGSKLIAGLKDGVSKEQFTDCIHNNTLEDVLHEVEVTQGDVLNIPAGLIHAIGDGILLAEVQQNSDTTYRVYDWGRFGLDGKPRELHVKQSLEVIDFEQKHSKELVKPETTRGENYTLKTFVRSPYFILQELVVEGPFDGIQEHDFEILMCVEGEGSVTAGDFTVPVCKGETLLLPAGVDAYRIKPVTENVVFVKTFVEEV